MSKQDIQQNTAEVGVVRRRWWPRFVALLKRHPLRTAFVGLILLAIIVSAAVFAYYSWASDQEEPINPAQSGRIEYLDELRATEPPEEPYDRAVYYSQLGQTHEALHNYEEAMVAYLRAQDVVDENDLGARISFYSAIADMAELTGRNDVADEYRQKANDYLEQYQDQSLEQEE